MSDGLQDWLDNLRDDETIPIFTLDADQWTLFWDILGHPPAPTGALVRVMRSTAQWDGNPKGENGEAG